MTFDGLAHETTVQQQMRGVIDGPRRHVRIVIDAKMGAPPWTPGEASSDPSTANAIGAIGGHRHEQLFTCSGEFLIDGEDARTFAGTGLRIRRFGARDVGEFPGHCWMSALFPSGKAFGIMAFPPRADGAPAFSEAFLFDGTKKTYGKVLQAPWMKQFEPYDGPCDLVLEMENGETVNISGRTYNSTYIAKGQSMFGDWTHQGGPHGIALPFHQGDAVYIWDNEQTFGMIERSLPVA